MKNRLIRVAKTNKGDIAINGRELHEFLREINTQYTKWMERMIGYGFRGKY